MNKLLGHSFAPGAQKSCRGGGGGQKKLFLFFILFLGTQTILGGGVFMSLSGGAPTGNVTPLLNSLNHYRKIIQLL